MNSDYSCYVTIVNKTGQTLILESQNIIHGSYVTPPAKTIPANGTITFQLQGSNYGPVGYGGMGNCKYNFIAGGDKFWYQFAYSCPHLTNDNSASVVVSTPKLPVVAIPDPIPTGGHPVRIQFTLADVTQYVPQAQLVDENEITQPQYS